MDQLKKEQKNMKRSHQINLLALILSVSIVVFVVAQNAQHQDRGVAGQQAPSWSVSKWHQLPKNLKELNVEDYKGKVLYLYFFQSWCPGCHKTGFPNLKKLHEKFKDDKLVEFVAIQTTFEGHGINTDKKLEPIAKRYELPIPFGQSKGENGTPDIMKKYRSGGTPWVVIVDKNGRVQFNDYHIESGKAASLIESLKKK